MHISLIHIFSVVVAVAIIIFCNVNNNPGLQWKDNLKTNNLKLNKTTTKKDNTIQNIIHFNEKKYCVNKINSLHCGKEFFSSPTVAALASKLAGGLACLVMGTGVISLRFFQIKIITLTTHNHICSTTFKLLHFVCFGLLFGFLLCPLSLYFSLSSFNHANGMAPSGRGQIKIKMKWTCSNRLNGNWQQFKVH